MVCPPAACAGGGGMCGVGEVCRRVTYNVQYARTLLL